MVFVDACDDSIMANDVVMPLNPLVVPVEEEELEEAPLDVNISQWSHDEKIVPKNGALSSQSFDMGLSIIS